ncbi:MULTISPECIES: MFS transporter [Streptomycetaceae]|uniref:MFS transporter n=1 Tax=Streptomycetaceae TaxID=2062 RepID=UPI0009A19AAB|nr:MFS transporter [Streptomyces sp. CB02056]
MTSDLSARRAPCPASAPSPTNARAPELPAGAALFALALGAFAVGSAEVVVAGLLPRIAEDTGVSLPTAGVLVSGYAVGMVVGAPLLTALGVRVARRRMLLYLVGLFIAAGLVTALAPGFGALLAGRVLSALAGGAYVGIASAVATSLVPARRRAGAIAAVFTGLGLANVLGVPGGTALGQALGWRATFWAVTALGVVLLVALAVLLPHGPAAPRAGLRAELRVFRRAGVWLALAATAFGWAPFLTVLTYVSPLLTEVTGFGSGAVPVVLMLVGVGMVVGTPLAGRLADRAPAAALYAALAGVTAVPLLLLAAVHSRAAVAAVFLLFGLAGGAVIPPLQARVLARASGADNLASAANISAFNIGNAGGPLLAGAALSAGAGYTAPLGIAAALGAVGLALAWAAQRSDRRG